MSALTSLQEFLRDLFQLEDLEQLSDAPAFRGQNITMSGFLLTQTELEQIPDAAGKTWEDLERDWRVLHQEGDYLRRILRG